MPDAGNQVPDSGFLQGATTHFEQYSLFLTRHAALACRRAWHRRQEEPYLQATGLAIHKGITLLSGTSLRTHKGTGIK
jgi:hypothetical protein